MTAPRHAFLHHERRKLAACRRSPVYFRSRPQAGPGDRPLRRSRSARVERKRSFSHQRSFDRGKDSTLKYLGVNLRHIATFPLERDEKDTAVCHIDHLRCHRVRAVSSALGAHPKALQRDDGRYPSPFDEDGAHADVADGRCGARR